MPTDLDSPPTEEDPAKSSQPGAVVHVRPVVTRSMRPARWSVSRHTARRHRSLGFHLLMGVSAVLVVFCVVASLLAIGAVHRTEGLAATAAAAQASVAARTIGQAVTLAETTVGATAMSPQLPQLFAHPGASCPLNFALDPFSQARLDIVEDGGRVLCTSAHGLPTDAGAPWLRAAVAGLGVSQPYTDPTTRQLAVAIAAAVPGPSGRTLGYLAAVLPLQALASQLSSELAGPQGYRFAFFGPAGQVLSRSGRAGPVSVAAAFAGGGMITGSHRIAGLGWTVVAGRPTSSALVNIRTTLYGELGLGVGCLLALLAFVAVVNRTVALPLARLADVVGRAERHRAQTLPDVGGPAEVRRLAKEFGRMVAARDEYEAQLNDLALHDPLTGLPNRALLDDRLRHTLSSDRSGGSVVVLFLDIDRFKLVNDSLGHGAGDQALAVIADRLRRNVRPGDTLARFGGDEFVVVCHGLDDLSEAEQLAQRLRDAVAQPLETGQTIVTLSASIGIAVGRAPATAESLLREADAAMYEAKELGRGRHHVYDEELRTRATDRLIIENELRHARARRQLWLAYQPIFDVATRRMIGVESLLRWDHPALGAVPPSTFVPVAEESGLIVSLGMFVFDESCRQLASWRADGLDLRLSVNVSGRQLTDADFPERVRATIDAHKLDPASVCLELTESVLMVDATTTATMLEELKGVGVGISIDDFGTGYSSLAYLHQFPFDELKIDGGFVSKVASDPGAHKLVVAMLAMAKALNLRVVAECVESELQLSRLLEMGCDLAQGFLLARPDRPEAINTLATVHGGTAVRR